MQPLVPADVDLRGMPFMPLDVNRLRDSQLAIHASGDEFRAAVLLWCASWNQVPAASLPNDERALAAYAGYARDLKGWKKVREGALRGFVLCDDGRHYHPVVAEKALEAWDERVEYREEKVNKDDRKKRERAWRQAAFAALRSIGITPEWNEKTQVLRALVSDKSLVVDVQTPANPMQPVTSPVTPVTPPVTVTGACHVTAKTETETETGISKRKEQEQGASRGDASPGSASKKTNFETWYSAIPEGADAIPEDHHVWAYADRVGLPPEFVALAWAWFKANYLSNPRKRYIDWPGHFRKAVEGGYGNLWRIDAEGQYFLTTQGKQLQRSLDAGAELDQEAA